MQPQDEDLVDEIVSTFRGRTNPFSSHETITSYLLALILMELKRANDRVEGVQRTEENKA